MFCSETVQFQQTPYGSCDCCCWAQQSYGGCSNCFLNGTRQRKSAQHAGVVKMQISTTSLLSRMRAEFLVSYHCNWESTALLAYVDIFQQHICRYVILVMVFYIFYKDNIHKLYLTVYTCKHVFYICTIYCNNSKMLQKRQRYRWLPQLKSQRLIVCCLTKVTFPDLHHSRKFCDQTVRMYSFQEEDQSITVSHWPPLTRLPLTQTQAQ